MRKLEALMIIVFIIAVTQTKAEFDRLVAERNAEKEVIVLQVEYKAETLKELQESIQEEDLQQEDIDYTKRPIYYVEADGDVDYRSLVAIENEYMKIPEKIRNMFQEENGKIYVSNKDLGKHFELGEDVRGCMVIGKNKNNERTFEIYVRDKKHMADSVIHEIGHYVDMRDNSLSKTEEFKNIHREEMGKYGETFITHESNYITSDEYFADSFMRCFNDDREIMQKVCPKTYEYIMEVVENI